MIFSFCSLSAIKGGQYRRLKGKYWQALFHIEKKFELRHYTFLGFASCNGINIRKRAWFKSFLCGANAGRPCARQINKNDRSEDEGNRHCQDHYFLTPNIRILSDLLY